MRVTPKHFAVAIAATIGLYVAASTAHATTRSLYERLGGQSVMTAVVSETIDQTVADPHLNQSFKGTDIARVKRLIVQQICELAGGGCHYSGDSMHEVHANHHITQAEFYGLVEILRRSLRKHHVGMRDRNELLALLAPMAPDIIEVVIPPPPKKPAP